MNNLRLFEAVGQLDEDLLERSEQPIPLTKKYRWTSWAATAACLCLICGLVLGAFGGMRKSMDSSNSAYDPPGEAESPEDRPLEDFISGATGSENWGLTLTMTEVTRQGATLVFTQKGGTIKGDLMAEARWFLQIRQGGQWADVPTVIPEDQIAWDALAYKIPHGGELVMPILWEYLYGTLDAGQYRIGVSVMEILPSGQKDAGICYGEFTLKG